MEKKIIGITGGVGAGKSSVLLILKERFGAKIILADLVAHELMEPESDGLRAVVAALGKSFLREDGSVDRKVLAELIFHDEHARMTMNAIIHPMVWAHIRNEALSCPESLVIVEAAVFETAPEHFFDEIWYVYTSEENRIRRLMESRGYTREKCESIIMRQESEEAYKKRSSRIIDNNGPEEETEKQLKEILKDEIC